MAGPYYEIGDDVALIGDDYDVGDEELVGDFMEIGDDAEEMLALAGAVRRPARRGAAPQRRQLSAVRAMLARNKALLSTRGPTKARTYAMGFQSLAIAAGGTVNIIERPQVPFRPERLIVPSTFAPFFVINDIKVGKNSQFANSTPVPAVMFQEDATNTPLGLDTAQVSQDVALIVQNISGAPADFRAGIIGPAVE